MEEFDAFVASVTSSLREQLRGSGTGGGGPVLAARAFAAAVDWTEPWLRWLLLFHASLWCLALATARRGDTQHAAVFFFALALVRASRPLNTLAAVHWREFAGQDYFDSHGVFASVMWAGPLLLLLSLMVLAAVVRAARLLVKVKRLQLRSSARKAAAEARLAAAATSTLAAPAGGLAAADGGAAAAPPGAVRRRANAG